MPVIGSLSNNVFERKSTGNGLFTLFGRDFKQILGENCLHKSKDALQNKFGKLKAYEKRKRLASGWCSVAQKRRCLNSLILAFCCLIKSDFLDHSFHRSWKIIFLFPMSLAMCILSVWNSPNLGPLNVQCGLRAKWSHLQKLFIALEFSLESCYPKLVEKSILRNFFTATTLCSFVFGSRPLTSWNFVFKFKEFKN